MPVREHHRILLSDETQVGQARRAAAALAAKLKFRDTAAGRLAIVVSELSTNVLKHATRGELVLSAIPHDVRPSIEVLAIDRGPGMDFARCLTDGYSTVAGSRGEGLGAIRRMSDRLGVYSRPSLGTVLVAEISDGEELRPAPELDVSGLAIPYTGEELCGDAWAAVERPRGSRVIVADGLGHGPAAADASSRAVEVFDATLELSVGEVIDRSHLALKKTRGAAAAVADVDLDSRTVSFAGIGNIAAAIVTGTDSRSSVSMVSMNGTVGVAIRKVQTFTYSFAERAVMVLCSDGISTLRSFEDYPGLFEHHPGVIYRDFRRANNDDVTVVVIKESQ
jgi:anti-sigma regulatory factor (Ser/Thr protein kinase)